MPGTVLGASGTVGNRTTSWTHGVFILMGRERHKTTTKTTNYVRQW